MERDSKGRILFILNPRLGHATVHVKGLIFKEILIRHGWDPTFVNISQNSYNDELDKLIKSEDEIIALAQEHDIVYLLKVNSLCFIKRLKSKTKAYLVFELTDALWRRNFQLNGWHNLKGILRTVDAIFSENIYIQKFAKRYNTCVYGLKVCTDVEKFELIRKKILPRNSNKLVIGWIGSNKTGKAIFSIIEPLERLFERYSFLEMRILGCDSEYLAEPLKNIRFTSLASYNEDEMIREAHLMDIGIFPAPSDIDDYKIRGPLKAIIYMSAHLPVVCLNSGDLSNIIQDNINGVLINSSDDWENKIEQLILDNDLRKRIGENAYNTIRDKYALENAFFDLENALMNVLNRKNERRKISGLKYKLIMNLCFFRVLILRTLVKIYKKIRRQDLQIV